MEPTNSGSGPAPEPANNIETAGPAAPCCGPAKINLWAKALVALFGLSLICAIFILLRGPAVDHKKQPRSEDDDFAAVSSLLKKQQAGVAWINVRGVITETYSSSPWEKGAGKTARRILAMAEKKNVKAIVLDINSPGGSVGAVQEIYDAVKKAREEYKKPVVALFRDVAASGGYYIAAPCDKIVAHAGTVTGSIGVIFQISNVEGLFQKIGVRMETIKSGAHKDIGSSFRAMTPEERKLLQDVIDDSYSQFFEAVKTGRKLKDEELKPIADGRIFTGRQALNLKLVDQLGGAREALELAGSLSGLGKNPQVVRDGGDAWENLSYILDSKLSGLDLFSAAKLPPVSSPGLAYIWGY